MYIISPHFKCWWICSSLSNKENSTQNSKVKAISFQVIGNSVLKIWVSYFSSPKVPYAFELQYIPLNDTIMKVCIISSVLEPLGKSPKSENYTLEMTDVCFI